MSTNENVSIIEMMYLSGTVSIPPRFPDLADISFTRVPGPERILVHASHKLSPRVVLKRSFFLRDVTAIFKPASSQNVDLANGQWISGPEDLEAEAFGNIGHAATKGIIYVRENAQSMLEVHAALTAAESAEYYPPLPNDRSVNHYNMDPGTSDIRVGCPR